MNPNPYESPMADDGRAANLRRPPTIWLAIVVSLLCLYAPVSWITFSARAPFWWSHSERIVFLITSPGEWFAQGFGARAYDYYYFAGFVTFLLLVLGFSAGRRSWIALGLTNLTLCGISVYTAQWLWHDLGR